MDSQQFPALNVTPYWRQLNDDLVQMIDLLPAEHLDWTRAPHAWSFRVMFAHIVLSRHRWLDLSVGDGERTPAVRTETKEALKASIRQSWDRLARFLSDPARLSAQYPSADEDGAWRGFARQPAPGGDGHWIAFLRLRHDIQHHAQVAESLTSLGVEHPY